MSVDEATLPPTPVDETVPVDQVADLAIVDFPLEPVAPPMATESLPVEPAPAPTPASPPAVPPTANQARAGLKGRDVATIAAGVVVGAALLATLLSMRSSASPEPAATPVNQTKTAVKPKPATPAGAEPAPRWSRSAEGRWLPPGPRSVALEVPAANKVHIWTRDVRPVLVVRCLSGTMDVFVFTDSAARMEPQDQDHTVRLTFDEGGERTERWPDSETHDALFARDGAAFAQELAAARSLRFGFTPHNAEPVVARFDVSGLSEQLAPAAKQCTPRSQVKAGNQRARAKRAEASE